jgi:hypothetical protein
VLDDDTRYLTWRCCGQRVVFVPGEDPTTGKRGYMPEPCACGSEFDVTTLPAGELEPDTGDAVMYWRLAPPTPEDRGAARFTYTRDDERRQIRIMALQPLETEDIISIVERQARDQTWSYALIYDVRGVPRIPATADMRLIADLVQTHTLAHGPRGPLVTVTRQRDLVRTTHQYARRASKMGFVVEVFSDPEDAEIWVDRQQRLGRVSERLWRLEKGEHHQTADIRTARDDDIELRLSQDGKRYYTHRHLSRKLALDEAERLRRDLEGNGWTVPVLRERSPSS